MCSGLVSRCVVGARSGRRMDYPCTGGHLGLTPSMLNGHHTCRMTACHFILAGYWICYACIFEAKRNQPSGAFTSVSQVFSTSGSQCVLSMGFAQTILECITHEESSPWQIKVSQRASVSDPWPQGTAVSGISGGMCFPSLSSDELTIVFNNPNVGNWDLYIATRPDKNSSFGPTQEI